MNIVIKFPDLHLEATLKDTPTGRAIFGALPLTSHISTWGDEIYFGIPVDAALEEGAKAEVSAGDLAYWPSMPAFCIFFGPTPASRDRDPVAASPVNVFGSLNKVEVDQLRSVRDGEPVTIEKA